MRLLKTALALAVAAVAVVVPAASAQATATPGGSLHLSWSAPGWSNQVFSVWLNCFPTGGGDESYMDADLACTDIDSAGGDLEALPGWWFVSCGSYQGPAIRTTATGTWFGETVSYDETHANMCETRRATGWVFLF